MRPKLFVLTGAITLLSFSTLARSFNPNLNRDLKEELSIQASKNHNPIGYDNARVSLLGYMAVHQVQGRYFVKDVYCEKDYSSPGLGRIPNNSVINVEHTWPQSKFKNGSSKHIQKSDLHHLYPTDSQLNSIRGNFPFGDVTDIDSNTKCPQSKIGYNIHGERTFEPPDDHKGNVARALFYFSVRYNISINNNEEATLRIWNLQDPVDEAEMIRNDQVESYQGNRNPFIDDASVADLVDNF